ncbi:hypothetical protein P152DRAFT_478469 [Eremomyces bilateralis CBS 781.70]|uniref:Zn(2)-C6 fungal-type domain-containing protein n=1 Tax=Eremomyces bilateralis CBS 781.70 TaxID=1392243 RepID=A0A6G1GHB9_9PEZI|nr:uncharacterized protein P152DRAFT_478469 [Eremomyces bilateralis CBS 781.70]KAF1817495.1 hypothetical protein P152DRAFT_478469 [Eremomyces bilateralis CBS 781.70]
MQAQQRVGPLHRHRVTLSSPASPTRSNLALEPTAKITSSVPIASILSTTLSSADPASYLSSSATIAQTTATSSDLSLDSSAALHRAAQQLYDAAQGKGVPTESGARRQEQPRMRSSIACARCRRSKVKCINNGVNTTCRACETTGRECTYPSPAGGGAGGGGGGSSIGGATIGQVHRREEAPGALNGSERGPTDDQTPKRQRLKRTSVAGVVHHASGRDGVRAAVDALDHSLLTARVWTELFEIWQQHFSIDLPFLHPPTFLKPLRSAPMQPPQLPSLPSTSSPDHSTPITPPASPLLLCAFLALTSRFHPVLVAHHSPLSSNRPSNPLIAAEFYAAAARSRLAGNLGDGLGSPDLERTQALLMLALHDWGSGQGSKAWVAVGVAIRNAQILGLQYETELDDEPYARSLPAGLELDRRNSHSSAAVGKDDAFIEQEIRRRTFWSCFVMDRYLSTGKFRPLMLNVRDFRIQLPSSERAFLFGEKVRTLMLTDEADDSDGRADIQKILHGATNGDRHRSSSAAGSTGTVPRNVPDQDDGDSGRWELGQDEGIVSRYVKLTDLYGKIVRYSCGGGRRRDKPYPPWHERSTFAMLLKQVNQFRDRLPRDLTLTSANISAHVTSRTSTSYALLHATLILCTMILHREFLPFLPLKRNQTAASGGFQVDELSAPTGFYEDSAKQLFKSARELIDLLQTCQEWGYVVQTPIAGFATYFAALLGVYRMHFPWMDPEGSLHGRSTVSPGMVPGDAPRHDTQNDVHGFQATRKAIEMVSNTRKAMSMADGWLKALQKTHLYFVKAKREFRRSSRSPPGTDTNFAFGGRPGQLRDVADVENTGDVHMLDVLFSELVGLDNADMEMAEAPESARMQPGSGEIASVGSSVIKNDNGVHDGTPDSASMRPERWNAINSAPASSLPRRDSLPLLNGVQPSFNPLSNAPNTQSPPINQASPHQSDSSSHPGQTLPSIGASPMISPGGPASHNPNATTFLPPTYSGQSSGYPQQPLYSPKQVERTVLPPPNTSQPPPTLAHAPWSMEVRETWLKRLDLRFTGDDVSAFVEGSDWSEWALFATDKQGVGGWLHLVWGGSAL